MEIGENLHPKMKRYYKIPGFKSVVSAENSKIKTGNYQFCFLPCQNLLYNSVAIPPIIKSQILNWIKREFVGHKLRTQEFWQEEKKEKSWESLSLIVLLPALPGYVSTDKVVKTM